nr:hypothetical protein CFP56_54879 [Quercus suber]
MHSGAVKFAEASALIVMLDPVAYRLDYGKGSSERERWWNLLAQILWNSTLSPIDAQGNSPTRRAIESRSCRLAATGQSFGLELRSHAARKGPGVRLIRHARWHPTSFCRGSLTPLVKREEEEEEALRVKSVGRSIASSSPIAQK